MDEQQKAKPDFYTKLSLPKFMALIHRLTPAQRKLVCSIGLGHLLEIKCEVLPRGMICYLVSKFDSRSRTFNIPNGPAVVVTSLLIHQVLGTPIGGRQIGEKADAELRVHISNVTRCRGRYPTICELDSLITADLDGDAFKMAFAMYSMTVFLCPSSHDAASPNYLHMFKDPDNIGSFDISAAVLEKVVSSVEAHNDGLTCVLGGNLLTLLIIYLDFKDTNIVPYALKKKMPRAAVWSTAMVNALESMDCISWDSSIYGKLPVKDVSDTAFARNSTISDASDAKSYDDLLNFVLSICPENHIQAVTEQLPVIVSSMEKDIVDSILPIIFENIINVLKIFPSKVPSYQCNEGCSFQIVPPQFKIPMAESSYKEECVAALHRKLGNTTKVAEVLFEHSSGQLNVNTMAASLDVTKNVISNNKQPATILQPKLSDAVHRDQSFVGQSSADDNFKDRNTMLDSKEVTNHLSSSQQITQVKIPEIPMLPVPDDTVTKRLDDEACRNGDYFSMKSLVDVIDTIQQEVTFDVPYPHSLAESLIPQKIETSHAERVVPTVIDLVSYVVQEILGDIRLRNIMAKKICTVDEKIDVFNELFISSENPSISNGNKRASWMSTNDEAVHCIALKKRARMFHMDKSGSSDFQTPARVKRFVGIQIHEGGHLGGNTIIENSPENNSKEVCQEDSFNDEEWEKEFVKSPIKAEQEYYARQSNLSFATQDPYNFRVTEISPQSVVSTFSSSIVEQEVFNDIVARIPKTARSKTVQIVVMGSVWVEHRVFGLSMQVYGKVHKYMMNMLGKSVMVEDAERKKLGIEREGHCKRYYFDCNIAALFQSEHENPGKLSKLISNGMLGFMLDTMDLIHLPLSTSGFYYLIVVNLKKKLFEVLIPNNKLHLLCNEASVAIKNFKMSFCLSYKNSTTDIHVMDTVFRSVCASQREGDSGIFVMKLICDYNGERALCFQPEHAKPLRESLTYYMAAHPFNEKISPETRKILHKHNIPYDYKTPGYFPWMHEQNTLSPEDSLEAILKF